MPISRDCVVNSGDVRIRCRRKRAGIHDRVRQVWYDIAPIDDTSIRDPVVESGRHTELLARGGLYAALYAQQFRPRERAAATSSGDERLNYSGLDRS